MGFFGKEIGRRKLIIEASKRAPLILVGAGASLELACSLLEKSNTATDPNLITEKNLGELGKFVANSPDFSVVNISHLAQVTKDSDQDNLTKLGAENTQFLLEHGIQSFSIAQDVRKDQFLVSLSLLTETKPGELFDSKGAKSFPDFILHGRTPTFKVETVEHFKLFKLEESSNLIANFYFPVKQTQIIGQEVIVILNSQLLNVAGQDLPPFALPFLLQIESPGPFA